jgi:hypothetical protein
LCLEDSKCARCRVNVQSTSRANRSRTGRLFTLPFVAFEWKSKRLPNPR